MIPLVRGYWKGVAEHCLGLLGVAGGVGEASGWVSNNLYIGAAVPTPAGNIHRILKENDAKGRAGGGGGGLGEGHTRVTQQLAQSQQGAMDNLY